MTAALETAGLTVRYGGVVAVDDLDLAVHPGELVALIGPNGAGKTSFIDAVTGFAASSGRVQVGGRDITRFAPAARARAGLARTWQSADLFGDLSVADNLAAVDPDRSVRRTLRELLVGRRRSVDLRRHLDQLGLAHLGDAQPDELSHGQRTLVGVARALVGDPRLVLLDEPAAGLDADESHRLGLQLRSVVADGPGMLLVDHDMGLVLSTCDRIVVMDFGRVIAEGTPHQIRNDDRVVEAYLGEVSA